MQTQILGIAHPHAEKLWFSYEEVPLRIFPERLRLGCFFEVIAFRIPEEFLFFRYIIRFSFRFRLQLSEVIPSRNRLGGEGLVRQRDPALNQPGGRN